MNDHRGHMHPDGAEAGSRSMAWVLILTLFSVFSFIDRQVINLLAEPIRKSMGLSDTGISLILGPGFALAFTLSALLSTLVIDRLERRTVIGFAISFWSMATMACGFAGSFLSMLGGRAAVGAGEALLGPSAYALIADRFERQRMTFAMSVYALGPYLGSGLAFLLGGLLLQALAAVETIVLPGIGPVPSWRLVLMILGVMGLLVSPLALKLPRRQQALPLGHASQSSLLAFWRGQWRALLPHHLGLSFMTLAIAAVSAWGPVYFQRVRGWSPEQFGVVNGALILVFCGIGGLLGGLWAGRLLRAGRLDGNLQLCFRVTLLAPVLGLLFLLIPSDRWSILGMIPTNILVSLPSGVIVAALQQITPTDLRGRVSAIAIIFANLIGIGLGPVLVALLTDHVFANPQALGGSIAIVFTVAEVLAAASFAWAIPAFRRIPVTA